MFFFSKVFLQEALLPSSRSNFFTCKYLFKNSFGRPYIMVQFSKIKWRSALSIKSSWLFSTFTRCHHTQRIMARKLKASYLTNWVFTLKRNPSVSCVDIVANRPSTDVFQFTIKILNPNNHTLIRYHVTHLLSFDFFSIAFIPFSLNLLLIHSTNKLPLFVRYSISCKFFSRLHLDLITTFHSTDSSFTATVLIHRHYTLAHILAPLFNTA